MKVSSPISQLCSIHVDPTGRNRRKMLVYSCAHSQAGERGKKLMDRFQERALKAEMLLCPQHRQAGTTGTRAGSPEQLPRFSCSTVLGQSNSQDNEHRSLPCKQDLTHPAQAWGIQQELLGAGDTAGVAAGLAPRAAAPDTRGHGRIQPALLAARDGAGEGRHRAVPIGSHGLAPYSLPVVSAAGRVVSLLL